jgi:hypothetical protein
MKKVDCITIRSGRADSLMFIENEIVSINFVDLYIFEFKNNRFRLNEFQTEEFFNETEFVIGINYINTKKLTLSDGDSYLPKTNISIIEIGSNCKLIEIKTMYYINTPIKEINNSDNLGETLYNHYFKPLSIWRDEQINNILN